MLGRRDGKEESARKERVELRSARKGRQKGEKCKEGDSQDECKERRTRAVVQAYCAGRATRSAWEQLGYFVRAWIKKVSPALRVSIRFLHHVLLLVPSPALALSRLLSLSRDRSPPHVSRRRRHRRACSATLMKFHVRCQVFWPGIIFEEISFGSSPSAGDGSGSGTARRKRGEDGDRKDG